MKELIIIGGGPAASAAAVYAARKRLHTLLITESFGGQSIDSSLIFNWIGTPEISGSDLAKAMETHVKAYTTPEHTLEIAMGRAHTITKNDDESFTVTTDKEQFLAKAVLIATGSRRRKLPIPGADTFEHKGVMYCATCDGPLFSGQAVAVIGGGNAAFEAVLQLAQYASHVTLLHRNSNFRADAITIDKARALPNATIKTDVELLAVQGDVFVNTIVYNENGTRVEQPIGGIFVEIGQLPNTELAKTVTTIDEHGKIVVDPTNQRATTAGIWAAGDCTNGLYHQNNIAAGDAVKAVEDLYIWLKTK